MSTQATQPAAAPSRLRVIALRAAVGLCCVAIGAGLSLGTANLFSNPDAAVDPGRTTALHVETDALSRIDELISAGDYSRALPVAREIAAREQGPKSAPAVYRVALCEETSGDIKGALHTYNELTAWRPAAALFGTARCQVRSNQLDQATQSLDRLESLATHSALANFSVAAEVAYWRAVLLLRSHRESNADVLDARNVRYAKLSPPASRYLRWGDVEGVSISAGAEPRRAPEVPGDAQARLRAAINQALAADADHPFALPLRLALVNLDSANGPPAVAAWGYELMLSTDPVSALTGTLEFNAGLCWLRAGELGRARVALLQAIDRSPGDELCSPAWWFVARTYLDAGDMVHAQRPLKRAAAAESSRVRAAASLGQAACQLLDGRDSEVHDALAQASRIDLRSPLLRSDTALIDAFARYHLARKVRNQPAIQTEDLLTALSAPREAHGGLGPTAGLIRALACRELGLTARSEEALAQTLPTARGALAGRVAELLADARVEAGKLDDGRSLLQSLLAADDGPARTRARLKLARVELTAGRPAECLTLCRGWEPDGDDDRETQLTLMGHAYAALKDSHRAADCFAGRYPKE